MRANKAQLVFFEFTIVNGARHRYFCRSIICFFTNLIVLGNLQTKLGEGRIFKDKYLVFREQRRGMQVKMVRWRSPGRVLQVGALLDVKKHAGATNVFVEKHQKNAKFGYNIDFSDFWRAFLVTSAWRHRWGQGRVTSAWRHQARWQALSGPRGWWSGKTHWQKVGRSGWHDGRVAMTWDDVGVTLDKRDDRNRKWLAVLYHTAYDTDEVFVRRTSDALWGRRVATAWCNPSNRYREVSARHQSRSDINEGRRISWARSDGWRGGKKCSASTG